jgi:integrase
MPEHITTDIATETLTELSPVLSFLGSLARGSRATQASALRAIARWAGYENPIYVPWARWGAAETGAVRARAVDTLAPSTARRYLAALRGVLRHARRLGLMDDARHRAACDIDPVRGKNELVGRHLEAEELARLFAACDPAHPLGARNGALLALLYACGLRRVEAVRLDLADFDGAQVKVRGKANRLRSVPVPSSARERLERWLALRGAHPGPLLHPLSGGRTDRELRLLRGERLAPGSVLIALRALARRAGVAHLAPHDLRRTYAGDLLDRGADLATVQSLMGHQSAMTTAGYDRRPYRARERAAELLELPTLRAPQR